VIKAQAAIVFNKFNRKSQRLEGGLSIHDSSVR